MVYYLLKIASPTYYGYINTKGKLVIPYQYTTVNNFDNFFASVWVKKENNQSYGGMIDTTGKWVLPPLFLMRVKYLANGYFGTYSNEKPYLLDTIIDSVTTNIVGLYPTYQVMLATKDVWALKKSEEYTKKGLLLLKPSQENWLQVAFETNEGVFYIEYQKPNYKVHKFKRGIDKKITFSSALFDKNGNLLTDWK